MPTRGIQQGDPISPYLFLLIADSLSHMVRKENALGNLRGIKIRRNSPELTHLLFADDSLLFLEASNANLLVMKNIFNVYCDASGQLVNFDKSLMFFSKNTSEVMRLNCAHILNINLDMKPGKYLGRPSEWTRSNYEALDLVKNRVINKLQGWKS